jgi:hypothetical protein
MIAVTASAIVVSGALLVQLRTLVSARMSLPTGKVKSNQMPIKVNILWAINFILVEE